MSDNLAINYRDSRVIKKLGIDALTKELGPIGMAHFIRQYDSGDGDYTQEKDELLKNVTMDDFESFLNNRA